MKIWNFQFPICLETVITGVRLVTEYDNDFLTFPLKSVEGSSNKYPDITIGQVHGRAKTIQKKS